MQDEELEVARIDDERLRAKKTRTRRTTIALGCLVTSCLACVLVCGLAGLGAKRHAADVVRHEPPPRPDPANETEAGWALVARARMAAGAPGDRDCVPVEDAIRAELRSLPPGAIVAFHEFVRASLTSLDTQPLREACQAIDAGGCHPGEFLAFRAYLVGMGRPTYELGLADDDAALARIVARNPSCHGLHFVALEVLREVNAAGLTDAGAVTDAAVDAEAALDAGTAEASDASVAAPVAAAPLDEPLPIFETTTTRPRSRLELGDGHPELCRRFGCGPRDVFR